MSIALLFEVQSEVRRLLIAGSELAVGDFRLKKLLPQMKKSGETAPVFARVADAIEGVVEPCEGDTSKKLLELANIVNAIVYTQGEAGAKGEAKALGSVNLSFQSYVPYRKLSPVISALTTKGSGRLEVIRQAYSDGGFKDLRLIYPLINALEDSYQEISDLVIDILEGYGEEIIPVLKGDLDLSGGKGHARRIELISRLSGSKEKESYLEVIEKGSILVKSSAIRALKDSPECEEMLLELSEDKKKEIREASLYALSFLGSDAAVDRIVEVFKSKEQSTAIESLKLCKSRRINKLLVDEALQKLDQMVKSQSIFPLITKKAEPPSNKEIEYFYSILDCMKGKHDEEIFEFLKKCLNHTSVLKELKIKAYIDSGVDNSLAAKVANILITMGTQEAFDLLDSINGKYNNYLVAFSLEGALFSKPSNYVYEKYSKHLKNGKKSYETKEILRVMYHFVKFKEDFEYETYNYYQGNSLSIRASKSKVLWDTRWIDELISIDEVALVSKLASKENKKCIDYLLKKLEANKKFSDYFVHDIVLGLIQAEYEKIMDVVIDILEFNFKSTGHYMTFYLNRFVRVLEFLPKESAIRIEEFAKNHDNAAGGALLELAYNLKNKALK